MQLPATCWKGMSAEDQVSNGSRHPKAGTKVPWGLGNVHAINAYLWKSTTAHGGQLYESIAVDPCPSMVLFFVLVFSGEDHLRVLFHWLLLLDLDGMTVHAKTVGCSLREAQTEFDTELGVLHLFEQAAGRNHALPTGGGWYLSICLEFLLHLNWSRNGFIPMVGRHYVLFTNCCILMYQNKSPHIVPLWVLFLCKSKGPTGAACGVRGRCG